VVYNLNTMADTKKQLKTLEEIKARSPKIHNANTDHYDKLNNLEKIALKVTNRVGTFEFFLLIVTWTILWIGWNTFSSTKFDPFPAFVLWLFISNMIQLMLLPLIMIGQNLQGKHSEARAETDFDVNVKAETEIETILQHLENQNELILQILNKLENKKVKK